MWSVVRAKSHLTEILRRARSGKAQIIGTRDPCVVVSRRDFEAQIADHDGLWLLQEAAKLDHEIILPPR